MLTKDQQYAFEQFKLKKNVFISGPAGSGKTYLIKHFKSYCDNNNIKIELTALTGIAAYLLSNAKTIHSWACIGLGDKEPDEYVSKIINFYPWKMKYWKIKVLVIDEISMMTPKLFELIDYICKKVRNNNKPFGGIQMVFCGDFFQLPPVDKNNNIKYCFESNLWDETINETIILREIKRQKDKIFQTILNEVRLGNLSDENIKLIQNRINKNLNIGEIKPTEIYCYKNQVNKINNIELKKLKTDIYDFETSTEIKKYGEKSHSESMIKYLCEQMDKDFPYEKNLKLAIGAQVMLLINKNTELGLVNGSRGIITEFEDDIPIVKFINNIKIKIPAHEWEYKDKKCKIIKYQFPLKLAWAMTVHKTQGCTLDLATIDIGNSVFEYGQSYVALSRVKDLNSISIKNFDYTSIKTHPKVIEFYEKINKEYCTNIEKTYTLLDKWCLSN